MTTPARRAQEVLPAVQTATLPIEVMTPMTLLKIATEQGADLEKLKQLMELQERWEQNEAKKAFVKAMADFKKAPPTIHKNRTASFGIGKTTYNYATLDNVCDQIIAALSAVGISHDWKTEQSGPSIKVTCVLTHVLGHRESTWLEASPDTSGSKNSIQAIGSTVSYLQRYTLLAATGLAVSGQDDDGAGAASNRKRNGDTHGTEKPTYPKEQFDTNLPKWRELVREAKKTPDQILAMVQSRYTMTEEQIKTVRDLRAK